jgi:GT2 family glycosyltransferase
VAGRRGTVSDPPDEVARLIDERTAARARRDWQAADTLRDELRSRGWEPVDSAAGTQVRPVLPPHAATGHASDELGSLLDEPATLEASLVTIVEEHPADLARLTGALRTHSPRPSWELVVVANAATAELEVEEAVAGLPASVLATSARLGWADAANLGLRRTRGEVIVLMDGSVEPRGEFLALLLSAFDDPAVGLAGPWGMRSADGRHFDDAGPGAVDALQAYCLAVRREAMAAIGGFDQRFRFYRNADLDLSFAIRDRGWNAVAVDGLPLERHEHRGWSSLPEDERERLSKRNFYRFLDHWGRRPDLLTGTRR